MQAQQKMEQPDTNQMWGCMFAGDLAIKKLGNKAIIIVGETRIGKSTLFNHLLKIPMHGEETQDGIQLKVTYKDNVEVEAKRTFQSVTLIPNIQQIKLDGEDVSLCDTAGFNDEARGYIGTFGVSYMLQKIFKAAKQIKIILVISHVKFEADQISQKLEPIIKFISNLKCDTLLTQKDIAQRFYNSIAFLVIKSREQPKYYLNSIKKMITYLEKQSSLPNERQIAKNILKSIVEHERLDIFERGRDGQQVPQSTILENLNQLGWQYYDFSWLGSEYIFNLPFLKEFQRMEEVEKNKYKKINEEKLKFIENCLLLLQSFLRQAKSNWYQHKNINYDQQFKRLRKLIENQPYGSLSLMLEHLNMKLTIPQKPQPGKDEGITRLNLIQQFKNINNAIVVLVQHNEQGIKQQLETFAKPFLDLLNQSKKFFCRTRAEEQDFIKFLFINTRSIEEAIMQAVIDQPSAAPFLMLTKKTIINIMPTSNINDLMAKFFISFKCTATQKQKYKQLFQNLMSNKTSITSAQYVKQLYYIRVNNKMNQAKILIKQQKYIQSLNQLLYANDSYQQYLMLLPPEDQQTQKIKQLRKFKQFQLYMKIAECLQILKMNKYAVKIYQLTKSIHSLVKCYERMIIQKKKLKAKLQIMQEFAKTLEQYGKKQKLISLYEQMIDKSYYWPSSRQQYQDKLQSILSNDLSVYEYADTLQQHKPLENNSDLMQEIRQQLGFYEKLAEQKSQDEDLDQLFNEEFQKSEQVD